MLISKTSLALTLCAALSFSTFGCAAASEDPAPAEETATSSDALVSSGTGQLFYTAPGTFISGRPLGGGYSTARFKFEGIFTGPISGPFVQDVTFINAPDGSTKNVSSVEVQTPTGKAIMKTVGKSDVNGVFDGVFTLYRRGATGEWDDVCGHGTFGGGPAVLDYKLTVTHQ